MLFMRYTRAARDDAMTIDDAIQSIYRSTVSSSIRDTSWVIPFVQSVHICAIAVVVGSALMTELRLAGIVAADETPYVVIRRYLPWMWSALAVLLATGLLMAIGEPERVLANRVFWFKMMLVLVGVSLSLLFRRPLLDPQRSVHHGGSAVAMKLVAWVLLVLWVAVIFSGRWIAYA